MARLRFYLGREGLPLLGRELVPLEGCRLSMDAGAAVKCSLEGCFEPLKGLEPWGLRIFPTLDDEPLGEFLVTSLERRFEASGEVCFLKAQDQGALLAGQRLEQRRFVPKNTNYLELLRQLLEGAGISRMEAQPCDQVLAAAREWPLGQGTLELVEQLLAELGYRSLWFDRQGYARLEPYEAPLKGSPWRYGPGDGVLEPGWVSRIESLRPENVFTVVATAPGSGRVLKAVAENDDPNSPISTVNCGRRMAPLFHLGQTASQQALQRKAEQLRDESRLAAQEIELSTALEPHGVGELLALEVPEVGGLYREQRWEMDLDHQVMHHVGRRVLPL